MNKFRNICFLPLLFAMVLLFGCLNTDQYYQERAVNKSREFLIENSPELTLEQREYVNFVPPAILHGNILGSQGNSEISQFCISWLIPGTDEVYMVFGTDSQKMSYFFPDRLIRKKLPQIDQNRIQAIQTARSYVLNNLYKELTPEQATLVRFSDPEIISSNFVPETVFYDSNYTVTDNNPEEIETQENFDNNQQMLDKLAKLSQFTILWQSPDDQTHIMVCGYSQADLSNWKINFGGIYNETDFKNLNPNAPVSHNEVKP